MTASHPAKRAALGWLLAICCRLALMGAPLHADGPDYGLPGSWLLPWACGEGRLITWDPAGHWEAGKATGVAYDVRMPEGTPVYAPADGVAHYATDKRPLEANLGHYVEIVVDDSWLIRLAHLRDPREGAHAVRAGDLVGHSGASGVSQPHLHIEILVREGGRWARPDLARLTHLFGLPASQLAVGAVVANSACPHLLRLAGPVTGGLPAPRLGEELELTVTLSNPSDAPVALDALHVGLIGPEGETALAQAEGRWEAPARDMLALHLSTLPTAAGAWRVEQVVLAAEGQAWSLPAEGEFSVTPPGLRLIGVRPEASYAVGERGVLEVWLENVGPAPEGADAVVISGTQPDDAPWRAVSSEPLALAPGEVRRVTVELATHLERTGWWRIERVGLAQRQAALTIGRPAQGFVVEGPELAASDPVLLPSAQGWSLMLTVTNVGTATAEPESLVAWGWHGDGDTVLAAQVSLAALSPGSAARVRFEAHATTDAPWRLVEAGHWSRGAYYRLALPEPAPLVPSTP